MELFTRLFGDLLTLVYHCFDRIVIHGYLSGLSRPEHVVYFVRQVLGIPVVSKEPTIPVTGSSTAPLNPSPSSEIAPDSSTGTSASACSILQTTTRLWT